MQCHLNRCTHCVLCINCQLNTILVKFCLYFVVSFCHAQVIAVDAEGQAVFVLMNIRDADFHRMCLRVLCCCDRTNCTFHLADAERCRDITPEYVSCCICLVVRNCLHKRRIAQYLNIRILSIRLHFLTVHARKEYIAVAFLLEGIQFVVGVLTMRYCKTQIIACNFRRIHSC